MYCKRCGARLQQGMVICPECGARHRMQASTVRCASCHGRAPAELTVCPHCGRNLQPAGPRWALWLAGVVVLASLGLWGMGRLPVNRVRDTVVSARANAASLVEVFDSVAVSPGALSPDENSGQPDAGEALEVVAELPATQTPTVTPTPTELVVTDVFTETAPTLETPALTVTVTLAVEAATTPDEGGIYTVQAGDSLLSISARLGIPWGQIAALNTLNGNSVLKIGQKLRLPGPTATPTATLSPTATAPVSATPEPTATSTATATPRVGARQTVAASPTPTRRSDRATTPTPTATAAPTTVPRGSTTTYRVRSGDTLSKIGAQFGVPWQDIARANGISASTRLNVGQVLTIPLGGPLPTATRSPSTATPVSGPAPQPQATPLTAPAIANPGDQTPFQGEGTMIVLSWNPVLGIPVGAQYRAAIRWTEGGQPQEWFTNTPLTEVQVPPWQFSKADQPERRYTWSVQVVQPATDGKGGTVYQPLSAPSAARSFTWN